jgi:hypothetical protein
MSQKLKKLLENEVKRFNTIIAYQDKLTLDEGSYRFYNEADEVAPEEPMEEPTEEPMDDQSTEEPMEEPAEEPAEEPMDDQSMEEPMEPMGDEEVTEVDVTDLVNSTNEINSKMEMLTTNLSKIEDIMSKVNAIETNLSKMDNMINQLQSLSKQVELMRPPTEEERRKALAKDSYPFNVTIDDYNKGASTKTQTDLENSSKMSIMDTLMSDYNDMDIKKTFRAPSENAFLKA